MAADTPKLVLASASAVRRTLLANAGLEIIVDPAQVDEQAIKAKMRAEGGVVEAVGLELAMRKARSVAPRHPGALVIGADQMLDHAGAWLDKPTDRAAAARQLQDLAGRPHRLISAAVIVEDGQEVWRSVEVATLHMRPLSAGFITAYLDRIGGAALTSVGAYQLEGLGAQLFTRVEGDYFTVLGLPLLPVLAYLRQRGVLLP